MAHIEIDGRDAADHLWVIQAEEKGKPTEWARDGGRFVADVERATMFGSEELAKQANGGKLVRVDGGERTAQWDAERDVLSPEITYRVLTLRAARGDVVANVDAAVRAEAEQKRRWVVRNGALFLKHFVMVNEAISPREWTVDVADAQKFGPHEAEPVVAALRKKPMTEQACVEVYEPKPRPILPPKVKPLYIGQDVQPQLLKDWCVVNDAPVNPGIRTRLWLADSTPTEGEAGLCGRWLYDKDYPRPNIDWTSEELEAMTFTGDDARLVVTLLKQRLGESAKRMAAVRWEPKYTPAEPRPQLSEAQDARAFEEWRTRFLPERVKQVVDHPDSLVLSAADLAKHVQAQVEKELGRRAATENRMRRLHGQKPTREYMQAFIEQRLRATMETFTGGAPDARQLSDAVSALLAGYQAAGGQFDHRSVGAGGGDEPEGDKGCMPSNVTVGVDPAMGRDSTVVVQHLGDGKVHKHHVAPCGPIVIPGSDDDDLPAEAEDDVERFQGQPWVNRPLADIAEAVRLLDEVRRCGAGDTVVVYRALHAQLAKYEAERKTFADLAQKEWADRVDAADRHSNHMAAELKAERRKHAQVLEKLGEVSGVQRDAMLRDLRAELEPKVRAEVEAACRKSFYEQLRGEFAEKFRPLAESLGFIEDDDEDPDSRG